MIDATALALDRFDVKFLQSAFDRMPNRWAAPIARRYKQKARSEGRAAANSSILDVLDTIEGLRFGLSSYDEDLRAFAKGRAQECFNEACRYQDADEALAAMERVALRYEIEPPQGANVTPQGKRMRLLCEKWWRRQVRRTAARNVEQAAIKLGMVHRRAGLYVSDEALQRRTGQRKRNREILASIIATNSDGQEYTLAELSDLGTSNPENRRHELMTRIAGFDLIAQAKGHAADFYTITTPSKYHARHHITGNENPKYNGATPSEAQAYLCKQWAKIRAALHRENIAIYGIRVAEPHHDGTPHWHMIAFMEPQHVERVRQIIEKYARQEDGDEPGADVHRFKAEAINRSKGSAAGYLAKYIAKNIDGHAVGEDYEAIEGKDAATDTARRVDAWASTWGIRQFQQFGGAPVTTWRELRRADQESIQGEALRQIVAAADRADWSAYVTLNGGPFGGDRLVTLEKKRHTREQVDSQTGEIQTHYVLNAYMEPAAPAVIGFSADGELIETRGREWVFQRRGAAVPPRSSVNNCTEKPQLIAAIEQERQKSAAAMPPVSWIPINYFNERGRDFDEIVIRNDARAGEYERIAE